MNLWEFEIERKYIKSVIPYPSDWEHIQILWLPTQNSENEMIFV